MKVENEQGVIVEFFRQYCGMESEGWDIISIQSEFPDAVVKSLNGDVISAEFEFLSSNFKMHRHDIRECVLIICWEDDWPDCIISVLELSTGKYRDRMPPYTYKEIAYLKMENSHLESQNVRLRNRVSQLEELSEDFQCRVTISDFRDWILEVDNAGGSIGSIENVLKWAKNRGMDIDNKNAKDKVLRWYRKEFFNGS